MPHRTWLQLVLFPFWLEGPLNERKNPPSHSQSASASSELYLSVLFDDQLLHSNECMCTCMWTYCTAEAMTSCLPKQRHNKSIINRASWPFVCLSSLNGRLIRPQPSLTCIHVRLQKTECSGNHIFVLCMLLQVVCESFLNRIQQAHFNPFDPSLTTRAPLLPFTLLWRSWKRTY